MRILCARETQKSIQDSVHKLLSDQIQLLNLGAHYTVEKARILGTNGTEMFFAGLKHNVANIKSAESVDVAWVEEAQSTSAHSWSTLIPTIRKENSEIWVSYNPDLESDATHQMFVVKQPPPGAVVKKLTWRDNPWFPDVLRREMEFLRETNPDEYNHVWEGSTINIHAGAIYANELRAIDKEGRITRVPYDRSRPVDTFWDLGWADNTSIWFVQAFPFEYRIIDYLDGSQQPLAHYLSELQRRGYVYGKHCLPHDAKAKNLGTGRSVEELMRAAGFKVEIVPMLSISDGINAARTIFPQVWFDGEKCADGLSYLRRYRYGEIKTLGVPTREPLHDDACFDQDTQVLTRDGARRIIDLPENGEVLTPCGWKPYLGPWITRRNAPLVEVRFTDGLTVRCTPDHLFLAESGWRSAESLLPNTLIRSSLTRLRSISMGISIGFGRVNDITARAAAVFTGMFGKLPLAVFPRGVTSTIEMAMPQTMPSQILSVCLPASTFLALGNDCRLETSPLRGIRPPSGTDQKREDCGTSARRGDAKRGRSGNEKTSPASIAARFIARLCETAATRNAGAPVYARPKRIGSVKRLNETVDVCCIHVPDLHCFTLANGAVVHNSHAADAFRQFAVAIRSPKKAPPPASRPQQVTTAWS